MKKIKLEKLIYTNYLKTALTSILFIEIALVFIYFTANNNLINSSSDFILKNIKKNVYNLVKNITSHVEDKFNEIEKFAYVLQNEHQNFFKYQSDIDIENKPNYGFSPNGMYYKLEDDGGSSSLVSKNTKITAELKKRLINSELFDNSFKKIVDGNNMVVAAYFNSYDNFNRYYPFIEDAYKIFPNDMNFQNYNFYYEADLKHNPKRKVVWTDVYLDPAEKGWMLSVIAPIYYKNFLEGVTGLDVTIDNVINNFLDLKLPYDGSSFLIDQKGNIVAMTENIGKILNYKLDESYTYDKKIDRTILREYTHNIFNNHNKNLVNVLKNITMMKKYSHEVNINESKFLLFSQKIKKLNWYVISLISEKKIVAGVTKLEKQYKNIGYLIIIFIILFYFLFFIFLYCKAKRFVKTINTPLLKIIEMTKTLGFTKQIEKLEKCNIDEIDTLNENFNTLANELEERTKKLVISEAKRLQSEELANTDALTGVYNRRFLDDFSKNYIKIIKREDKIFSLLLIDIDNFKHKNDTYGHDVGDIVIKSLISRLKNSIRENDLIVRLGGDEFLILLPNTHLHEAKIVAKKFMYIMDTLNKLEDEKFRFTITIGCSQFEKDDISIESIIKRADISLYEGKKSGKNCFE